MPPSKYTFEYMQAYIHHNRNKCGPPNTDNGWRMRDLDKTLIEKPEDFRDNQVMIGLLYKVVKAVENKDKEQIDTSLRQVRTVGVSSWDEQDEQRSQQQHSVAHTTSVYFPQTRRSALQAEILE